MLPPSVFLDPTWLSKDLAAAYQKINLLTYDKTFKIQCPAFATPVKHDNGLIILSGQCSGKGGVTIHRSNDRNYAALKYTLRDHEGSPSR